MDTKPSEEGKWKEGGQEMKRVAAMLQRHADARLLGGNMATAIFFPPLFFIAVPR